MAITYNYNISKITASFFEVEGGTSSQFLKADGSVDSNTYITAEANDLSTVVTWAIVPDAYISQSSVTQHEGALTITQSQISDLNAVELDDLSVTTNPASGGGSLSYDNLGTFTYTPPFPTLDSVTINGNTTTNTVLVGSLGVGAGITFPSEAIEVAGNVEAIEFIGQLRGPVLFKAKAGEDLLKGDVVYISGISGQTTVVSKACAAIPTKMPAFGLVSTNSSNNTACEVVTFGTLSGVDTAIYTEGAELYVSTTPGAMVSSPPTGESSQIQKIAKVTRSAAASGSLKVMGAGRTNAVPNLNHGNIFIGNALNQAETRQLVEADISDLQTYYLASNPNNYISSYTVTEGDVTQHQAALSITESQISDFGTYLTTETDPIFSAHTTSNIIDGTGRLQNDGIGNWSYDNSTYYLASNPNNYISSYTVTQGDVTQHQAALSITESQISDLQSYQLLSEKGAASGYASLDASGKVLTTQLPALALTEVSVVADQTARLALTAQEGDVAIQTDTSTTFIHNGGTAGTNADWEVIEAPVTEVDPVFSAHTTSNIVNGVGFLKNNNGAWSYDNSTYLTSEVDTLATVTARGAVTTTTSIIPFLYANQAAFPSASTYHGAIAHSHADGAMYFAHGSVWNKLANDSQLSSYYLASNPNNYISTAGEINDLTANVTWANVPDLNITQTSVTQHQAALSITESQISDLQNYLTSYTETQTLDAVTTLGNTTTNNVTVGDLSSDRLTVGVLEGSSVGMVEVKTAADGYAISLEENSGNETYQIGINPSGDFLLYNSKSTTPTFIVDDGNRVGINVDPSVDLDIADSTLSDTCFVRVRSSTDSGYMWHDTSQTVFGLYWDVSKDYLQFYDEVVNTERGHIKSDGQFVWNSDLQVDGDLSVGADRSHGGIVGPNTVMTIPLGTTRFVTLANINTGYYRIDLVNNGNSGYNAVSLEVDLTFNSIDTTNHAGFQVLSQTGSSSFAELVEVYGKYVSASECQVIIKYTNSATSDQALYCQITGLSNIALPVMVETVSATDPVLTNREPQHEIIGNAGTPSSTHRFRNGNTTTMSITGGNVGIGTGSPFFALDVESSTGTLRNKSSSGTAIIRNQSSGGNYTTFETNTAGQLDIKRNGVSNVAIDSSGNVSISSTTASTSTSTGALTVVGGAGIGGTVTANSIVKSGGTASQFLKADGTVDATVYSSLSGNNTFTGTNTFDTNTNTVPVNITRLGSTGNETLQIGVTDGNAIFNYIEDTTNEGTGNYGTYLFQVSGNEGTSPTITALSLDEAGATLNGILTATGATLSGLSAQASEATALMINGSNVVGTRELGSNAFTSTAYYPDSNPDGYISSLAFNNLTSKTAGTGDYLTTGDFGSGENSGGVAMTVNDGYGNANLTFNHRNGTPDNTSVTQSACRIEATTDSNTGSLSFEISNSTIQDTPVALTQVMYMSTALINAKVNLNAEAGLDVTGNITVTGTVDGVDIGTNAPNWNAAYNDKINSVGWTSSNYTLTLTQQDAGTLTQVIDTWDNVVLGGSGTIGGNTWANGTFHLGSGTSGWAMDSNEFYNSGAAIIGTLASTLTLNPSTSTTTSKPILLGSTVTLSGLSAQASEATALMINGSNVVGTRELGSNAFNSTAFLTGNQTITLSGDVTGSGTTAITCTVVNDSHTHDTQYTGLQPTARGMGWEGTYGATSAAVAENAVTWDNTEKCLAIKSNQGDTSIGAAYRAVYAEAGATVRWTVTLKGSAADADGLYLRLYGFSGTVLSDGKTHVSNSSANGSPFVQEETTGNQDHGWYENGAVPSAWTTFERSWTVPATGYYSLVILNWSGFSGIIYVRQPDVSLVKPATAVLADTATTATISAENDSDNTARDMLYAIGSDIHRTSNVTYNGSQDLFKVVSGARFEGATTCTSTLDIQGTGSNLDMLGSAPATDARYLYLPRGGGITLYGSTAINHGIFSRNLSGVVSDDVRINSYGGVSIILDTNSNNSSGADFHIGRHSTGTADLGFVVSGETYDVTTEGNLTAYGTVSDIRYKEDIEKIDSAVERLQKINGVTFKYKEKDDRLMGVIAQELLEDDILKLAVYENETVQTKEKRYAVRYEHLTAMLIEAIKEQQKQIDELKEMIRGITV